MNTNLFAKVAGVAALVALPLASQAAEPARYFGLHVGQNNLSSWNGNVDFGGGVSTGGNLSLDGGRHFGLQLGRQTEKARYEVEYQRGNFDLTGITLGPVSADAAGSGNYQALTANYYRIGEFSERWTGYAGLGIGLARVSLPGASFPGGCDCFAQARDTGFVWQARLGLEYRFDKGHHAFAQYTYLNLPGVDSGGTPGVSYDRKGVGAITIGYRKTF